MRVFLLRKVVISALISTIGYAAIVLLLKDGIVHEPGSVQSIPCTGLNDGRILKWTRVEKWIVLTSSSTRHNFSMNPVPGWKMVVVLDHEDLNLSSSESITFLSPTAQRKLGYNVLKYLPVNSHSRKILGYLYAMGNGAQIIFDTDYDTYSHLFRDNSSVNLDTCFALDKTTTRGLLLTSNQDGNVINPFKHFSQTITVPRGYAVQPNKTYNNTYTVCPNIQMPWIQQGVVSGAADVDAKKSHLAENDTKTVSFDPSAPPVFIPNGIFAPFNSKSVMFQYKAFWGLVLLPSLPQELADIWRGYWAQKLLWKVKGQLGFYLIYQGQNHDNQSEGIRGTEQVFEETRIHSQAITLIQILTDWDCPLETFFGCVIHLSETIAQKNIWSWDDVHLVLAWIEDLKHIGYKEPELDMETFTKNTVQTSTCCDDKGESIAVFYPVDVENMNGKKLRRKESLQKFCNFVNKTSSKIQPLLPKTTFPSTLLIVTFNEVSYAKHIWLLDLIYRTAYPNIVYCLPFDELDDVLTHIPEFTEFGVSQYSIVRANTTSSGSFAYECTLRAIEMNYFVSDYFILQDDVLFNFWNNGEFNPDEMWIYRSAERIRDTQIPAEDPIWAKWPNWGDKFGLGVTKPALRSIYQSNNEIIKLFLNKRKSSGYKETDVMYGESDSYRVPREKKEVFYQVGTVLRKFQVFMEIAVHIIMSGISPKEAAVIFPGISLWEGERLDPLKYFDKNSSVIHPVKLSQVIQNLRFRAEYCEKYVENLLHYV